MVNITKELSKTLTNTLTGSGTELLSKVTSGELLGSLPIGDNNLSGAVRTVIEQQLSTTAELSNSVNNVTHQILDMVGQAIGVEAQIEKEVKSTSTKTDEDNQKTIKIEINQ